MLGFVAAIATAPAVPTVNIKTADDTSKSTVQTADPTNNASTLNDPLKDAPVPTTDVQTPKIGDTETPINTETPSVTTPTQSQTDDTQVVQTAAPTIVSQKLIYGPVIEIKAPTNPAQPYDGLWSEDRTCESTYSDGSVVDTDLGNMTANAPFTQQPNKEYSCNNT